MHEVRHFMTTHRASTALARKAVEDYDGAQLGHAVADPHGHGTGFWDRGLGEAGDRLSEAVRGQGAELSVSQVGTLVIG